MNHNFNGLDSWNNQENNDEALSITNYANGYFTNFGKKLLRIESNNVELMENGVYQMTETLPAGEYTLSAYSRIMTAFTGTDNPGAYIRVTDSDNNILSESEHILVRDNEYFRLVAPFEITSDKAVKVHLLVNGSGVAYFDGVQLENNPFANDYNMLENGNFELSDNATWEKTSGVEESTMHFNMSKSIKMTGEVNAERNVHQTVYVKRSRLIRETFTLSGWAKGTSVSKREREGSEDNTFRLRAVIHYSDADYNEYGSETYTADFSPATDGWQFASIEFSKNKFRSVDRIEVYCDYDYNAGIAYFDDIQLVRNSIEKNLGAEDFEAVDTTYYAENTDDELAEDTAPVFEEKQDTYGNTLTDTQFTDGEFGTIYRAFGFTPDGANVTNAGNDLIKETDERGNVTSYTVNEETSRNEEVTDRLGNKTAYEYDLAGRTTKVTNKNAAGTELANVSYSYDSFDNMTEIVRGDGMKYVLAYNAYHNLESIGINGKSEKLVQYTYKNGNGRLKAITYANGDIMKASYNSIGQLIAEKWFNSLETLTAHYKYVYDGQGNIVRSVDVLNNKEYMYIYEGERLVRSVENDVVITNDLVTKRTVAASVHYVYDSEGNITKKRIVTGTDEQVIYLEKAENDSTVVKFTAGGKTVTSHSKTDSFGRKVFDELQLGTGFASRQFKYYVGKVTDEHVDNDMFKSTATTKLVSSIRFSDGRIISYEYDAEERITKVIDSIEGTSEYTYDALGQLIKEVYDGGTINEMTYDSYGNILTKNGVAYTYGDTVWKDKLTAVGNETITYDAQGNPISYLGHALTWEKGRQLKSFDNYSYTYNANGIRTSKTIDGVKHTYLLDGTKILKETWGTNTLIPMYDNEESVCGIFYNDEPYYFLKNLQGDVISIVDKASEVVARYIYDAWGVCTITWDDTYCAIADINPFRYRGYYYDEEIEMYYLQSRYYNPRVGRFLNSDDVIVIVFGGEIGHNVFNYCKNNSINQKDSSGYIAANIVGAAIGAIIGVVGGVFLGNWLADVLKLSGWKRGVFVAGVAALVGAAAGAIGYFIGPYVAKIAVKLGKYIANLVRKGKIAFKKLSSNVKSSLRTLFKETCCFVAGTQISTPDGKKAIEEISVGDSVYAVNTETGEYGIKKVSRVFERHTHELVHVVTSNEEIVTTKEHPFWVNGKGWVAASNLHQGYKLCLQNGKTVAVTNVFIEKLNNPVTVYNFEVADWHTYFVGSDNILVHNKCSLTKIKESYLKQKGFDAHAIKKEIVGKNNISKYDMYYDKETGLIFLLRKGAKAATAIATGYFIK